MRFGKEIGIVIIILVIIFLTEYITSKNLDDAVEWMTNGMISIENKINEKKELEAQDEFYQLKKKWEGVSEQLALFVEHNELEKVSKNIIIIESNFENDETKKTLENIAELKFMLDHIEEKNKLKLKNMF